MSEKKSKIDSPHYGIAPFDPEARRGTAISLRRGRRRETTMTGPGFFDSELNQASAPEVVVATHIEPKLTERALRLEEGAPMYEVRYNAEGEVVIPRTMEQADAMFIGRLPMSLELKIDKSCLERGKRGGTVIKRVGKSIFGAFTIAIYSTVDEAGKEIDLPVLADMRDRRLRRDNEVLRFRREASGALHYLSLPRISRRRAS